MVLSELKKTIKEVLELELEDQLTPKERQQVTIALADRILQDFDVLNDEDDEEEPEPDDVEDGV